MILNLHDFEPEAENKLDPAAFAYYAGGAADEVTLRDNLAAFHRHRLRPRVLVDVTTIDTTTTLLGARVSMPVGIAPMAQHAFAHPDGECVSAAVAAEAGVIFCAPTMASRSLEEIAAACAGPRWFQLYTLTDRDVTAELVRRAAAAGYGALVLTGDLPVPGMKEREQRAGLSYFDVRFGNFDGLVGNISEMSALLQRLHDDRAFSWRDIAWLRAQSPLPLVLKGVLTAEDARLAVEHGCDAVWVSNHGGRQLDRSPAAIDVLEEVVQAVDGRAEVYLDSGVRRGVDVLVALALGAKAAFVGRPILYALAVDGREGVARALSIMREELENAMAILGTTTIAAIRRDHVM